MDIAEAHSLVDIRFMGFGRQRISEEHHEINVIVLDLSPHLLFPAEMARQKFVYIEIRNFLDQFSCGACCIKGVFAEDPLIGNTEVLHELFFGIVRDQSDIHCHTS